MLLGSVGWLKLMAHRRRVEWVNESLIEDGVMGCRGIHGEGGVFFFFWRIRGERIFMLCLTLFFCQTKNMFCWTKSLRHPKQERSQKFLFRGADLCY